MIVITEGIPNYDELKLRIGRGTEGSYQVVAFGPDGSTASSKFELPFDEIQLDNFVLRVGRPRRGVRSYRSSQMEDAKRFGSQLFDALLVGSVRDVYLGARRVADQNDRGLRVTLYLTDVPALMGVPWEFLYDRPGFLSQSIYTPVVRSLDLKTVRPPRKLTLPLRILGIVSRPQGFETLDVAREQEKLRGALSALEREGMVELRWLERATLSALDDAVSAPEDIHVLHYIGHGAYDVRTEGGILVLENADGGPHEVTGEELGSLLQDERSLRLVVLNSCEGARGSHVDPFSGVASSLVESGTPAVVGMQFEITDEAAITFAGRLYSALAQGFPIDAAIAQSRKAIFAAGNDIEFGTPVLFLRGADARLFTPEQPPGQPQPSRLAPEPDAAGTTPAPVTVATEATAADPDDTRVSAPAETADTEARVDPGLPKTADIDPAATQEPDREDPAPKRATLKPAPRDEASQRRGRPPRRVSRRSIVLVAGGALAVALAVLLIGTRSDHKASIASVSAHHTEAPAGWRPVTSLQKPIMAAGVAEYKGELWVVGGSRDGKHNPVPDVNVYIPAKGWLPQGKVPQLHEGRFHGALVSTDTELYEIGGTGPHGPTQTVYRLDKPTGRWTELKQTPLPEARSAGAAAWDGTRIVFAGGNGPDGRAQSTVWTFTPGTGGWVRIGNLHQPRSHLAAASNHTTTVWFAGGEISPKQPSSMVDVVADGQVMQTDQRITAVTRAAAIGVGQSGFCTIGGSDGNGHFRGQIKCSPTAVALPQVQARADLGAAARVGGKVYAVGGYNQRHRSGLPIVEALSIKDAR